MPTAVLHLPRWLRLDAAEVAAGTEPQIDGSMSVILILILVSLGVALAFLGAFVWAVRSGQYEDTETPSMRILADEDTHRAQPLTRGN